MISFVKKWKTLERTMRSVCVTCSDPLATASYATKPEEIIKTYCSEDDVDKHEDICEMTLALTNKLEAFEEKFSKSLSIYCEMFITVL